MKSAAKSTGDVEEKGRSLLYKEGDIIVNETAWIFALSEHGLARNCSRCLFGATSTSRLLLCASCKLTRYCSKTCQLEDWKDVHKGECKIFASEIFRANLSSETQKLKAIHGGEDFGSFALPFVRVLLKLKKEQAGPEHLFFNLPSRKPDWYVPASLLPAYRGYEPLIKLVDPNREVCPNADSFLGIADKIDSNLTAITGRSCVPWLCNGSVPGTHKCDIGAGLFLYSSSHRRSCQPNVLQIKQPGTTDGRTVSLVATRDIYVGEHVETCSTSKFFATTGMRQRLLAAKMMCCKCPPCSDPAFEALTYGLKCVNLNCTAVVPSDERALQPCRECGGDNKSRLKRGNMLIGDFLLMFDGPKESGSTPSNSQVTKELKSMVSLGEELLHSSNLLMGMAYKQLADLAGSQRDPNLPFVVIGNRERIEYLKKMLDVGDKIFGKINLLGRTDEPEIIDYYLRCGPKKEAMEWLGRERERYRIICGADSEAFRGYETLCTEMDKSGADYKTFLHLVDKARVKAGQK